MKRAILVLVLLAAFVALLAAPALALVPPPPVASRIGGSCVWANGKVYWFGGVSSTTGNQDTSGKTYMTNVVGAGISIYNPESNTWESSKYDGTGPLGFDYNSDGKCDSGNGSAASQGLWTQTNQGFAYDDDNDGVQEIFCVAGYAQDSDNIWKFDPNAGARGSWSKKTESLPPHWASFRRGCIGLYGSKVFLYGGAIAPPNFKQFGSYDLTTNAWTNYADGPVDVERAACAVCDGKMYIIGGDRGDITNVSKRFQTAIYKVDLTTNPPTWTTTPVATLQTGVECAAAVAYNHKVFIIGGMTTGGVVSKDIQVLNTTTNQVTTLYHPTQPADLPFPGPGHVGFGATVDPGTGTLYMGGGGVYFAATDNTTDPVRADYGFTDWYKSDLNATTLSFARAGFDPAYFPYEDWDGGMLLTGKVTDPAGNPVTGAIVGVKHNTSATADAAVYFITDSDGNYGPADMPSTGGYYVAAWKEGWSPTADVPVTSSGVADLQLTQLAGKNIAIGATATASSDEDSGSNAGNTIDGDVNTNWRSVWYTTPQDVIVDLGSPKGFNAITIAWFWDRRAGGYSIDVMPTADPMDPANWSNTTKYQTVYTTDSTNGGWADPSKDDYHKYYDPIRLPSAVTARGIRVHLTGYTGWPPCFGINELKIHSDTEFAGLAYGKIQDVDGNPIYNAAVQLGGHTGSVAVTGIDGSWSFPTDPGTYEVYADAPGFNSYNGNVSVPGGGVPGSSVVTLQAKNELDCNGSFEATAGGDELQADGWSITWDKGGNAAMYSPNTRFVGDNTTPGGNACGYLRTATPGTDPVWVGGWITKRFTVDPNNQYNCYFKDRLADGWSYNQWMIRWLRANGSQIEVIDSWDWIVPTSGWTQETTACFQNDGWNRKPTIRIAPPADAAYAEFTYGHKWSSDPNTVVEYHIDDFVFDEVTRPALTGKVTDTNGNPVAGAIVGVKNATNAAADAANYGLTDVNGNYKVAVDPGTWYAAAWRAGFGVSSDTPVSTTSGDATADFQLATSKKNLCTPQTSVTATAGSDTASKAVDIDCWSAWDTGEMGPDSPITAPASITLDLGSVKPISSTVIQWAHARAADFTVEITSGDPNSTSATWSTVYSITGGNGGWYTGTPAHDYWRYIDPIRFAPGTQARGMRITATKGIGGGWKSYAIWDVQIFGTAAGEYVNKVGDIKKLAVGTVVKINRPVSVSGATDGGYGPAGMTFWMEEIDRSSGIKVVAPVDSTTGELAEGVAMGWAGEVADVTGTVAKDATGEVYIKATNIQTWQWWGNEFAAVGMNNKALTGMATGLYVKTWGTVKSIDPATSSFTISDGSTKDGAPVEITVVRGANMRAALPAEGQWVSVKGALCGGGKIYEWPVDGFIRGWLINGAYSVEDPGAGEIAWQSANLLNDFLGGESTIEPTLGGKAPAGAWFAAGIDGLTQVFDFNKVTLAPVSGQPCSYASVWIKPGKTLTDADNLQLRIGSGDGYVLYINNSYYENGGIGPFSVTQDGVNRGIKPDEDTWTYDLQYQPLVLVGGEWNHVMLKLNNIDGDYGFAARFAVDDPANPGTSIPVPFEVSLEKPAN